MRCVRAIAICFAVSWLTGLAHAAIRTVALSGQSAPNATETVFDTFGAIYFVGTIDPLFRGPVLNDLGQVAFRANLTGENVDDSNRQGVWSEGSGSLALVARTGSQAPGVAAGTNFGIYPNFELFTPAINNAGQTAFFAGLSDGRLGLWSEGSGTLAVVAADGIHSPALPSNVNFSYSIIDEVNRKVWTDFPLINDNGQVAVSVALTGPSVTPSTDLGVWLGKDVDSLTLVHRKGDQAAGLPTGVRYHASLPFALNNADQIAMFAFLQGSGVTASNDTGFWAGGVGSLALVARKGHAAPGTEAGTTYGDFFAPIVINNSGHVAFEAWVRGSSVVEGQNDEALWSSISGSVQLVARSGSQAAGLPAGVSYGLFSKSSLPLLNDANQLAFHSGLAGSGVDESNNEGIWFGEPNDLALIARRGQQAPDTPDGVGFGHLHYPALNELGQVAFRAQLVGNGVDASNDRGIWATDGSGSLQLLVRTGEELEVAPGDFRTIEGLDFVTSTANGDGRRSAFNNLGQLAFWASFTDGSQGVFVSNAVAGLPGDFDGDGDVDGRDLLVWQRDTGVGSLADWQNYYGRSLDFDGFTAIGNADATFVAIPEPATLLLCVLTMPTLIRCRLAK